METFSHSEPTAFSLNLGNYLCLDIGHKLNFVGLFSTKPPRELSKLQIHKSQFWKKWFMKLVVHPKSVILNHAHIDSIISCCININLQVLNNLKSWERTVLTQAPGFWQKFTSLGFLTRWRKIILLGASMRHSARGKGHEEGGLTYAKAESSLRSPPGNPRASTPITRACLFYCFVLSPTPLTLRGAVSHHLFRRRS